MNFVALGSQYCCTIGTDVLLLASKRGFGTRYREEPPLNVMGLFIVLLGFAVLGVVIWFARKLYVRYENRVVDNPRALFNELCRAHGLRRADRDLLCEIADWHELADPVPLFLERSRLASTEMRHDLNCDSGASYLERRIFDQSQAS